MPNDFFQALASKIHETETTAPFQENSFHFFDKDLLNNAIFLLFICFFTHNFFSRGTFFQY